MDPVTLIVAALAGGAATGLGESTGQAVKDAYQGLRAAVAARFAGHAAAERALQAHAADPDTQGQPLAGQLRETGADQDPRIVALAQELVRLLNANTEGPATSRYELDLRNAQGVQIGDHTTQTNTFG
jgi:hypothetical protein